MTAPHVSVVIPVHNAEDTLLEQLDAIHVAQAAVPSSEILIVDNRSSDRSAAVATAWAEQHDVDLRVIEANDRPGEPYARNVGVEAARSDLIAFCDADDRVGPGWLGGLTRALRIAPYGTGPIDMTSLNPAWLADVRGSSVTGRSLMFDQVPYAHGCNMGFRKSAVLAVGGFDERYHAGCDLDIALRFWDAGYEMGYDEDAVVQYRLRPSLRTTYSQGRFYGRYRVHIRHRLALRNLTDRHDPRLYRRILWLARRGPEATWSRSTRARWVWVLGQLVGEFQGRRDPVLAEVTS